MYPTILQGLYTGYCNKIGKNSNFQKTLQEENFQKVKLKMFPKNESNVIFGYSIKQEMLMNNQTSMKGQN